MGVSPSLGRVGLWITQLRGSWLRMVRGEVVKRPPRRNPVKGDSCGGSKEPQTSVVAVRLGGVNSNLNTEH